MLRAGTEGLSPEALAEAVADEVLWREVRMVERAEGEESMAVEAAPLMLIASLHFLIAEEMFAVGVVKV